MNGDPAFFGKATTGYSDEAKEKARQRKQEREENQLRDILDHVSFADAQPLWGASKLVKGWLEQEQVSLIFGPPGCGKTFFALDQSLHVAMGRDWNGCRVQQGGVVYVACEAGKSIRNRLYAFKLYYDLQNTVLPFEAVTEPVDLCHADNIKGKGKVKTGLEKLVTTAKALKERMLVKPSLIVIDTVSRALNGGNENSPDDMGSFVGSLDRLRAELECHVCAIHHIGKDQSRGARGHSLLLCAVDTAIEVEAYEGGVSTSTIVKQRDGVTGGGVAFRLRSVELGRDEDGDPVTSCVVERGEKPEKQPSGKLGEALKLLEELIRDRGQAELGGRSTIETKTWREACARAFEWRSGSSTERVSWSRIWKAANEAGGRVGVSADGNYLWFKTPEEIETERQPM